jgi:hypothetical protein
MRFMDRGRPLSQDSARNYALILKLKGEGKNAKQIQDAFAEQGITISIDAIEYNLYEKSIRTGKYRKVKVPEGDLRPDCEKRVMSEGGKCANFSRCYRGTDGWCEAKKFA